jgi:hypothetical protein
LDRACFGALEGLEGRTLMSMSVVDFDLVNADTDTTIMPLKNGTVIDLANTPTRNLTIRANKDGSEIDSVRFTMNGANIRTDNHYPYAMTDSINGDFAPWTPSNGSHVLTATPYTGNDATGAAGTSRTVSFSVINGTGAGTTTPTTPTTPTVPQAPSGSTTSGASAAFVDAESDLLGNWKGTYGSEGYNVLGDTASIPSYARVTPSANKYYYWTGRTVYGNELQRASGSGYVAATWYSNTSYNVDVSVTDGKAHKVTMYFLDFEGAGRRQKIEVLRASDGAVLDTRTLDSDFDRGKYLSWNVKGDVRFRITRTAGINAVVSGIFFDPADGTTTPTTPTTPATPTTSDLVAPSQDVIDKAIAQPLIRYNRSIAGGAHTDQPGSGEAPMLMAAAAMAGNTTADARILQQIRYTITGGNDITANGGYPSQHERHVTGMITVAKQVPRIWNQLSNAEKSKVSVMMKASLVASAFTTSDTNPYVLAKTSERALDGDSNIGRNWNPNYREGMVGGVLVAMAYFGGPDAVADILDSYDHDAFVAELKAHGLSNSYQTFNWKTANPSANAPTGDMIEKAVENYRYLGLPIDNYMGIYWKLTENTYGKTVNAGLNGGAGIDGYGRILSGADALPNKGVLGMLKEFDSSDANGARSSATYAYDGYRVNQTNMYVMIASGYWNKASAEAQNSLTRIKVGATDLWYKLSKGYSNYAKGASRGTDSLAENGKGFEFTREMWEDVLKEYHNIA